MTPLLLAAAVAMLAVALGLLGTALLRLRRRSPAVAAPAVRRILFPFAGDALPTRTLAAALRLAVAEQATLVPTFLARVSYTLPLDAPLPRQCGVGLSLLDAIEQQAARVGVPVDARIERGRDVRHALRRMIEHERYDRIVVAAVPATAPGFHSADVAWLLDHAPGEIVVLRPGAPERARPDSPAGDRYPAAGTAARASSSSTYGTPTASATGA